MIFIAFIYPILEAITSVILTFCEMLKSNMTIKVTQANSTISKMIHEEDSCKHIIGFATTNKEDSVNANI